ncbi:hypothetical protein GX48_08421 [Paracoccidioides brasiliensis]|nr:hypothetical protein GX48_08421 [Paracoccidioides brasiliensis]
MPHSAPAIWGGDESVRPAGRSAPHKSGESQRERGEGRKGHRDKLWRWLPEDDARLLSMMEEERRPWPEVERCFPERTESALRQRVSTLRKQERGMRTAEPAGVIVESATPEGVAPPSRSLTAHRTAMRSPLSTVRSHSRMIPALLSLPTVIRMRQLWKERHCCMSSIFRLRPRILLAAAPCFNAWGEQPWNPRRAPRDCPPFLGIYRGLPSPPDPSFFSLPSLTRASPVLVGSRSDIPHQRPFPPSILIRKPYVNGEVKFRDLSLGRWAYIWPSPPTSDSIFLSIPFPLSIHRRKKLTEGSGLRGPKATQHQRACSATASTEAEPRSTIIIDDEDTDAETDAPRSPPRDLRRKRRLVDYKRTGPLEKRTMPNLKVVLDRRQHIKKIHTIFEAESAKIRDLQEEVQRLKKWNTELEIKHRADQQGDPQA